VKLVSNANSNTHRVNRNTWDKKSLYLESRRLFSFLSDNSANSWWATMIVGLLDFVGSPRRERRSLVVWQRIEGR